MASRQDKFASVQQMDIKDLKTLNSELLVNESWKTSIEIHFDNVKVEQIPF